MTRIVRDVEINCPPHEVYEELRQVRHLPSYSHLTVDVRDAPEGAIAVGDTFGQVVTVLGVEFETDWVVVELQPDRLIHVEGTSPANGSARLVQTIEPAGGGCRVEMAVEYEPPLGILGDIADRLVFERRNEEDAERILERLREHCERGRGE